VSFAIIALGGAVALAAVHGFPARRERAAAGTQIRLLQAETRELLGTLDQPDPEQSAWSQEATSPERQAVHQCRPGTATAPIKQQMLHLALSASI
jgi:hypothetical protein